MAPGCQRRSGLQNRRAFEAACRQVVPCAVGLQVGAADAADADLEPNLFGPGLTLGQLRPPQGVPGSFGSIACMTLPQFRSRKPAETCVPSQNGLLPDAPQRHSATRLRTS